MAVRRERARLTAHRDDPKPFLDHLEELRGTIFGCLGALVVGMLIAFPFTAKILEILKAPLMRLPDIPEDFLRSFRVTGAIAVILRVGAWSGLLLAMPFIVYFVARFVFPGLTSREKSVLLKASGFSLVLFVAGVAVGYFGCMPVALRMMLGFHAWIDVAPIWTINDYVAFTIQMMIGFGLSFQLPVIIVILGKLGVVNQRQLRDKRRHAIVICLTVGMLMTPADVATQLLMAAPLYALYEMCIWILWFDERKAVAASGAAPPP